jgi:hypothetical protein
MLIFSGTLPLFFYTPPSSQEAGDGTPFKITWDVNGLMKVHD